MLELFSAKSEKTVNVFQCLNFCNLFEVVKEANKMRNHDVNITSSVAFSSKKKRGCAVSSYILYNEAKFALHYQFLGFLLLHIAVYGRINYRNCS